MTPLKHRVRQIRSWHYMLAALLLLVIWWGWTGVWVIQQNEAGVVQSFGAVTRVVPAGIHLTLPAPFERLHRVEISDVRSMSVGITESGSAGLDRIREADRQYLTGDTNIVDLELVIQYRISDPRDYLFGVAGETEGSQDDAVRQLAESELTRLVASMPIDEVLSSGKARLQLQAKLEIQKRLDELGFGITLLATNLSEVAPPFEVIAAFNDVTSAVSDRERALSEADGFGRDLIPSVRAEARRFVRSAETYRDEVVNRAEGAAERFRALAAEIQNSPVLTRRRLLLETMTRLLQRGEQIIYPSKDEPFVLRLFGQ